LERFVQEALEPKPTWRRGAIEKTKGPAGCGA
jgi:hypothetical protein